MVKAPPTIDTAKSNLMAWEKAGGNDIWWWPRMAAPPLLIATGRNSHEAKQ